MPPTLIESVEEARTQLNELVDLTTSVSYPGILRDGQARTDAFLMAAARHSSAANTVLVGLARKHLGRTEARRLSHELHLLDLELGRIKARLYGSAAVVRQPWRLVWATALAQLEKTLALESALTRTVDGLLDRSESEQQAATLDRAERRAPTRPHPYVPTRGLTGRLSRGVWSIADRAWDSLEGRTPAVPTRSVPTRSVPARSTPSGDGR